MTEQSQPPKPENESRDSHDEEMEWVNRDLERARREYQIARREGKLVEREVKTVVARIKAERLQRELDGLEAEELAAEPQPPNNPFSNRPAPLGFLSPSEADELQRGIDEVNSVSTPDREAFGGSAHQLRELREQRQQFIEAERRIYRTEEHNHAIAMFHRRWERLLNREEHIREIDEQVRKYDEVYSEEQESATLSEPWLHIEQRDTSIDQLWNQMGYLARNPTLIIQDDSLYQEWLEGVDDLIGSLESWQRDLTVREDYYQTQLVSYEGRARADRRFEELQAFAAEKSEELRRWKEKYAVR